MDHFLPLGIQEKLYANICLPLYPSEEYWASLQESAFTKLVQMFKGAVTTQLHYWTESAENNCHIKALLEILKKLHRVNQTKSQLPENIFKVNELTHWFAFYGDSY